MIAVDASLIGAFILKEEGWESYAEVLGSSLTVDHALKEVSNAIWKAHIREHIGLEDVGIKFEALKRLASKNLTIVPEEALLDRAMEIALSHRISIYDSLYLALSLYKSANLASLDETQISVATRLGIRVVETFAATEGSR